MRILYTIKHTNCMEITEKLVFLELGVATVLNECVNHLQSKAFHVPVVNEGKNWVFLIKWTENVGKTELSSETFVMRSLEIFFFPYK